MNMLVAVVGVLVLAFLACSVVVEIYQHAHEQPQEPLALVLSQAGSEHAQDACGVRNASWCYQFMVHDALNVRASEIIIDQDHSALCLSNPDSLQRGSVLTCAGAGAINEAMSFRYHNRNLLTVRLHA